MEKILYMNLILIPILAVLPALILYFIVKTAVKNAIKEGKRENII